MNQVDLHFFTGRIPKRLYAKTSSPELEHFFDVFAKGKVAAALDASIFHYREISIQEVKEYLIKKGINIRINK